MVKMNQITPAERKKLDDFLAVLVMADRLARKCDRKVPVGDILAAYHHGKIYRP